MTEADWLTSTDPQAMLTFLRDSGKLSERQARLFAVACCRRVWHLLDETCRSAVEVAERYADGQATESERIMVEGGLDAASSAVEAAAYSTIAVEGRVAEGASSAVRAARVADQQGVEWGDPDNAPPAESLAQADLLRDIFGPLPFRPVTLPPSVRTWNGGTIPKLAEAAYRERALPSGELDRERLAVLADGLEEVGADSLLLDHLRGSGPRVRGDWVVDLLTGRE